ncbi:MAG: MlaD family protein [Candidatus Puniceispirillaceae bacterium]
MKIKSSDFTAGLFVIGGLFAIITMFFVVKGQLNRQDSYHSYFNNVAGLRAGASVVYEGYIIGTVNDITPEQTQTGMTFRVDIGVKEGWAIPSDSNAEIAALSLLSAQSIQIIAGSAAPLTPGDLIPSRPATNLMADLGRTADQFATIAKTSLVPLLATVDSLLNEEARDALTGLTSLSKSVGDGVPALLDSAARTADNLERASQNVADISGNETKQAVQSVLSDMVEASDNVNETTKSARLTTDKAGDLVTILTDETANQWLADIAQILMRIDNSAAGLEQISQSALASAQNVESLTGRPVRDKILTMIDEIDVIRGNLEIASESVMTATENAADLSDISEDRINAFLQKLENAALNIEEMTARLRDDPSIIIRGSN